MRNYSDNAKKLYTVSCKQLEIYKSFLHFKRTSCSTVPTATAKRTKIDTHTIHTHIQGATFSFMWYIMCLHN